MKKENFSLKGCVSINHFDALGELLKKSFPGSSLEKGSATLGGFQEATVHYQGASETWEKLQVSLLNSSWFNKEDISASADNTVPRSSIFVE